MLDTVKSRVNGLDLNALSEVVEGIQEDASQAKVSFDVTTRWQGQTRSETTVDGFTIAGQRVARSHKIVADEPCELLGSDGAPNPQELLMAAVNACMTGFLGLDDTVAAGYEAIDYVVTIAGNGTPEQFEEIHQTVMKTSPNYFNLNRPIRMNGILKVD
jgi:uncharacterized OsmC-like protein